MPVPKGEVMYACPGGMDFASSFSDDGDEAILRMPGQPDIELSRVPAGSGFAYSDSYYELRGRGREVTLTAAGRSMRCHAAGQPGEIIGAWIDITATKAAEARLNEQIDELRRWHALTLGREMRVLELKREVNALLAEQGQPPRYPSATAGSGGAE